MSYTQLQIPSTADQAEHLSDLLIGFGALSVTFVDQYDQPILEPLPNETPLWSHLWINAIFPEEKKAVEEILQQIKNLTNIHFNDIKMSVVEEKQDWVTAWQNHFHAMRFGRRLWICPSHEKVEEKDAVIVTLDPGLAFGTGTHPTTSLCLEWLDEHLKRDEVLVDYGCGSGILAIAAAKLGAQKVWAVDIDPQALISTHDNAEKNNINAEQLQTCLPEELKIVNVDIILANILLNPLLELAKHFHTLLKTQGQLVVTGVLASQINQLEEQYQSIFTLKNTVIKDDWARLDFVSKK